MHPNQQLTQQSHSYELAFTIENTIRLVVHNSMIKEVGIDYFNISSFPKYDYTPLSYKDVDVVQTAKTRKGTETVRNIGLGLDFHFLWYLDFGILLSILDVFWDAYFHHAFITPSRIHNPLITALLNIIPFRNAIAHNRYIALHAIPPLHVATRLLEQYVMKPYLDGYDTLALDTTERAKYDALTSLRYIITLIEGYKLIDAPIIATAERALATVVGSNENNQSLHSQLNQLPNTLTDYNRLPRKPGRIDILEKFVRSHHILETITSLISDLEACP